MVEIHGEDLVESMNKQLFGDNEPPQEFKDRVRETMMKDSPKVRGKLPKRLYHGTRIENEVSIREQGILAHTLFGNIYFCESMEDVLLFMKGEPCIIFEVNPKQLLPKRFRISLDHNKAYYPCEVFSYYGNVPPGALTGVTPITKKIGAGEE